MASTRKKPSQQAIDWKRVELVYEDDGRKVPAMLKRLGGPAKAARDAYSFFATELVHQDQVSPGGSVVAPLLVPFATDARCPVQGELLTLLGVLASQGDPMTLLWDARLPVEPALLAAATSCQDAAVAGLASKNARVRVGAALLLSATPDDPKAVLERFRARLGSEQDVVVRATLLFGLVIQGRGRVTADVPRFQKALAAKAPLEQVAGLVGLVKSGPLPASVARALPPLLEAESVAQFPFHQGNVTLLAVDALRTAALRDADPSLLLSLLDGPRAHLIVGALAPALFPKPTTPDALDAVQRAFLDTVTRTPAHFRLIQKQLERVGLPTALTPLRRALGLPANDALDVTVTIGGRAQTLLEAFTRAVEQPSERSAIAAALTKGRSGEEVMQLCVQLERASLGGLDADGCFRSLRVSSALLAACTDEKGLLEQLRTFDFYDEVETRAGHIVLVEALRVPIALELARRSPGGDEARFAALSASAFDRKQTQPMWVEALRALSPPRRVRLLDHALIDSLQDRFSHGGLYVPLLLETPSEVLASSLTSWLGRLRKRWQAERRSGPRLFEAPGLDAKRFKTLPAGQHPTLGQWLGPASAYVPVLRAAKLTKQADALEKAVEQFLAA